MQSDAYWVWLSCIPEVTPKLYYQILREYGSPRRFFEAMARDVSVPAFLPERARGAVHAALSPMRVGEAAGALGLRGIRAVTRLDAEYPAALETLEYPPPTLFVRGSLEGLQRAVGIVGTRRCTRRGAETARRIAAELGEAGYTVVSGLARGIDAAAHQGAVDAGAPTVAVLGCGVDVIYPPENAPRWFRSCRPARSPSRATFRCAIASSRRCRADCWW